MSEGLEDRRAGLGRLRRQRQVLLGATAVVAAVALGGVVALATTGGSGDALSFADPTSSPSSVATSSPSPSPSPSPSDSPSPSPSPSPPPPSPSPSRPAPPTPSPSPSPAPAGLPETTEPQHGGRSSAVYLAVAYEYSDPELARAEAQAGEAGYSTGVGDVGCDQGAYEALGLDPDKNYVGVALYFADRETAQQFVDAYEPGVVGIAEVTTYCLD